MSEPLARTVSGQITRRLRERILNGSYGPGSALLQDAIAAEFGVSKIPVREALVQLRAEGLVAIFEHRGFQVRKIPEGEFDEIFRLRHAIEPEAIAEGARLAQDADREDARLALARLDEAMRSGLAAETGDLHVAFHLALIVPRIQPTTADVLLRLHSLARRHVLAHLQPAGGIRRAMREHGALHEAWRARKARAAARLAREHIEEAHRELEAAMRRS